MNKSFQPIKQVVLITPVEIKLYPLQINNQQTQISSNSIRHSSCSPQRLQLQQKRNKRLHAGVGVRLLNLTRG